MRISTAAGLVDVGLLIEAMKEKNKKGEDKYATRKTPQEPSACGGRNK